MKKFVSILCAILCVGVMGSLLGCNGVQEHVHTYSKEWTRTATAHWHKATCGHDVVSDKGDHEFVGNVCKTCSYTKNPSGGGNGGSEHEHEFSADFERDEYYHWHKSTCGHDVIDGKESHTITNSICTQCGYIVSSQSGGVIVAFNTGAGAFDNGDKAVAYTADGDGHVLVNKSPLNDGFAFVGWFDGNTEYSETASYTQNKTFTAKYASGNTDAVYNALFDENTTVTFDIDMSDAEWKKLNQDHRDFQNKGGKAPIYRLADSVTISVATSAGTLKYYYEEIGVRMKGNTSRHEFYGDDGFYSSVHYKLSFCQTFDDEAEYKPAERKVWSDSAKRKARKNRAFATLEKVDVKWNSTADESYVKDIYAMKLFRDNGIAAPNATLCAINAKNRDGDYKNLGVYKLFEAVDDVFIARNFPTDAGGDLYKCSWGSGQGANFTNANGTIGIEDELVGRFYTYDKKTNKKATDASGNRDFSSMRNFIAAVGAADASGMSAVLDIDYFAKFEAINYILGNPDCIRNNYNNFYTYFRPSDGRAIFIPYDYDRCLGITKDWDPTGSASMYVKPFTRSRAAGGGQDNPIYVKLIDKGAPYGAGSALMKFRSELIAMSTSPMLSVSAFNAYKDRYKANYDSVTQNDAIGSNSLRFDADTCNVSYEEYITKKLETLNYNIDNYVS